MRKSAGFFILLLVIGAVFALQRFGKGGESLARRIGVSSGPPVQAVSAKGCVGGEKIGFLEDDEVKSILKEKYGLTIDYAKAGSIEMAEGNSTGQDFLWPSSQIALEIYKAKRGSLAKSQIIFNSPIVLYSWDIVADALIRAGIVRKIGESFYVVDFPKLIRLASEGKEWKDIGLPELYGKISIYSTDPTKSNSGNMFAGLLANVLNGGQVVTPEALPAVLPGVKKFFSRLGFLDSSSGDLFSDFLSRGVGDKPIIVGYESQLIEFSLANRGSLDLLRKKIRILYPRPTVWSSHPLIALNEKGEKLMKALQDPDIQRLAWEKHGFRSGLIGVTNDPKTLSVVGVPETIQNVMPMPTAPVMQKIIDALSKG